MHWIVGGRRGCFRFSFLAALFCASCLRTSVSKASQTSPRIVHCQVVFSAAEFFQVSGLMLKEIDGCIGCNRNKCRLIKFLWHRLGS